MESEQKKEQWLVMVRAVGDLSERFVKIFNTRPLIGFDIFFSEFV